MTLVCVLGQIRAADRTWAPFKKYVLDELDADLALCIHTTATPEVRTPFHDHAKYIFECREDSPCWAKRFDEMNPAWRSLADIPGDWIGPTQDRKGSGGILLYLRWFLYQNLPTGKYDQIIVTRSDFLWRGPHPKLDMDHIWIPNAEFHGGVCDRHCVIPARFAEAVLTAGHIEDPVKTGQHLRHVLAQRNREGYGFFLYNIETFLYLRFIERKILPWIGFFPSVQHLIREDGTPKYPDELETSQETVTWPFSFDHKFVSKHGMFCGRVFSNSMSKSHT